MILFTADHGDMLGNHQMWAKRVFYENSAHIPMILSGLPGGDRVGQNMLDNRLVGLQDVMPTLLDLCGLEIPDTVEGLPMVGEQRREWLYGEISEGPLATRMVHDGRYKLIYYPVGNVTHLFDLQDDPCELHNLAGDPALCGVQDELTRRLISKLYNGDEAWAKDGTLVGLPDRPFQSSFDRGMRGQRGGHWSPPPAAKKHQQF
ncbi:MAG: DUF4976 domain-containing protein [Chloroflexi bacterium]|nr:DUF4976 domain-containing protein [Chloroflexota bacterium]